MKNADLQTSAVLVTGAASGVGRSIAEHAVDAGAKRLFLTDVDAGGLSNTAESLSRAAEVATYAVDLSYADAAPEVFRRAKERFGDVDRLVNSAALTTRASFLEGSAELWDSLFAINARAPFLLMKEMITDLLARGVPGSIVNIQSINAHCGAPELAIYSATKGALQTLTKNAANAHLKDQIRVNGINLGWASTESEHKMQMDTLGAGEDWLTLASAKMPLGRLILPEEVARMAIYLLSNASAPMTGVSLDLDQSVLGAPR